MTVQIHDLSNAAALEVLQIVVEKWISERGLEFYRAYSEVLGGTGNAFLALPAWITGTPTVSDKAGKLARHLLIYLAQSRDDEVKLWTQNAIDEVADPEVHMIDPLTLTILGVIVIGAILAARIGPVDIEGGRVEFYEGLPPELADILKAFVTVLSPGTI
jgi:hypothetical protein